MSMIREKVELPASVSWINHRKGAEAMACPRTLASHIDGRDHEYDFRSVERSARPADVPRNVPVERACMIHVEVEATKVVATVRSTEDCNAKLVRAPHCRFAGVWAQAKAKGTATDIVARVAWLSDEQWFFDIDLEGKGGGVSTFPDRCP